MPNTAWFSMYRYCLLNEDTGAVVQVNLVDPPIYNGQFSHRLTGIERMAGVVFLEEGSCWRISFFDRSVLNKWVENYTNIIGVNENWTGNDPHILINVTADRSYCSVQLIN
jgi:hypothetical protein